jgi:excinuclease ABC subunit A
MHYKDQLEIFGARQNNLKSINLAINHNKLVVITGLSGSGKSTLAFDTIFAEGQRRYVETFSPYTRQFLERLPRPTLDSMHGVRPAIALEQKTRITNSRSTVGTVTEINDYLKIIWPQISTLYCPKCSVAINNNNPENILKEILTIAEENNISLLAIAFNVKIIGEASLESLLKTLNTEGFIRFFCNNTKSIKLLNELSEEDYKRLKNNKEDLIIVVDRIKLSNYYLDKNKQSEIKTRILASLHQSYHFGDNHLTLLLFKDTNNNKEYIQKTYTKKLFCTQCDIDFELLKSSDFSFNSPLGACKACKGFGKLLTIDPSLCVPDTNKSIKDGAVVCWNTASTKRMFGELKRFCSEQNIDITIPWEKLSVSTKNLIFNGQQQKKGKYKGVTGWFNKLQRKIYKMHVRVFLSRYRSETVCPECMGTRLKKESLNYKIEGLTITDVWNTPILKLLDFAAKIYEEHKENEIVATALLEIKNRLHFLVEVGLGYLTLDRQSRTLSGGESQRVNLTSILGAQLVNTTIVLDEPSVGLHARDTDRLVKVLFNLRDVGNTVILVEHDPDIIRHADEIIDLGPGAASKGGNVIYQGPVSEIGNSSNSITGKYIFNSHPLTLTKTARHNKTPKSIEKPKSIEIIGANANNINNINVSIPLGKIVSLTGVSGSGKSTLINQCLYEPYTRLQRGATIKSVANSLGTIKDLKGLSNIDDIILIDQSPVGKTPRSNPATYTRVWELIRECLSETPSACKLGLSKSAFSFNVDGGRCPACKGAGYHRIEMQFLADVFVECELCAGDRFQSQVLEVRFHGKNVKDLLHMSLIEASEFFAEHLSISGQESRINQIMDRIKPLLDLGLGYLQLGQPLSTVSGGEAQRIKLAKFLSSDAEGKQHLFLLDEPTTGLHVYDTANLINVLRHLCNLGHSVLVIEHNLDVIQASDWMIELGPEGGDEGGRIVVQGEPKELLEQRSLWKQKLSSNKDFVYEAVYNKPSQFISIVGARHNNLKNISLDIPKNTLAVITGVSGSGKSTLAFDILFAEGQRRYIDCLSPYARQYITQLKKADFDAIYSIPPTIAISQKTAPPLGISTIATTTELYQYLRLLYSKIGIQHCPDHNLPISSSSVDSIADELIKRFSSSRIFLFAPVVSGRKGHYNALFQRVLNADIDEARIDGKIIKLSPELKLERHKLHSISLLIASISQLKKNRELLKSAIEQCLLLGMETIEVSIETKNSKPIVFSSERGCPKCKKGFSKLDPQDFSFRSNRGVCKKCSGYGYIENRRHKKTCTTCNGARIGPIGRHVYLDGKSISDLTALKASELLSFLKGLTFDSRLEPILTPILTELVSRLGIIISIGLDYLTLDRESSTLSGGEAQRLRLARALGSPLSGICYVLDEPTIGIHPQDHQQLLKTLCDLRDNGNTVVVVEHDEDTIRAADYIIDVGPEGGSKGGNIIAKGSLESILNSSKSVTGKALREKSKLNKSSYNINSNTTFLELYGAKANNLKSVFAKFPLNALTVVAGVSGAGKSSLIHESLVPALCAALEGKKSNQEVWNKLKNHNTLERFIEIDQSPVGKTSSSTPASYLGIFDEIRKVFELLPESQARGWKASHFSFNTSGGRCTACSGKGILRVPMSFLPDAITVCEKCNGSRYDESTKEVKLYGYSIADILSKTLSEAREIFVNHKRIRRALDYVHQLGLGYLTLGQPTYTLSGGEAQRLKIVRELSSREAEHTLYVFDEPTTGLHMLDVVKLINVIRSLVTKGNTVIVIEHNLDFISAADYLIELGPGPGDSGGEIIFSGRVDSLLKQINETPTKRALNNYYKENMKNFSTYSSIQTQSETVDVETLAAG